MRFSGRTILVTGASEGIGRAVTQGLAREGAHVVMVARRPDVLESAAAAIRAEGGSCETACFDVADTAAFEGLIADLGRRGRLDGLVNNAFVSHQAPIEETTLEDWRRVFTVNVEAVFVGVRAALPVMKAQGGGAIVNIASVSGVRARMGAAAYSASKAAVIHLGAIAAIEGAAHNVRVNSVVPGATKSASFKRAFADWTEAEFKAMGSEQIPLGRFAEPEDVAKGVIFLLSDDAGFVTGEALRVEGGAYWKR